MADQGPTVIETRSGAGAGIGMALLAVAIIVAAIVGFMFLQNDTKQTTAVTGAAQAVGDAATKAGDAVKPSN